MTNKIHPERHHAMSAGGDGASADCNVVPFPVHHDGRSSPLSRYAIRPASAFLFRALAAKRPRCAALIDELMHLEALIEAKKGLVEPAIIAGMEITHDLILLQIGAMKPETEAYAALRRAILQEYRAKTTTYGLLPELLASAPSLQAQAGAAGASHAENKS